MNSKRNGSARNPPDHEAPSQGKRDAAPARFSLIYESDDGRFCLFEDGNGHITAVRSSALA